MPINTEDRVRDTLYRWLRNSKVSQLAHYEASRRSRSRHIALGLITIITAVSAGTSILVFPHYHIATLVGSIMSICVAVFAALQTFLGYAEIAVQHRLAAAEYAALVREIELFLLHDQIGAEEQKELLERVKTKLDTLAGNSPAVPENVYGFMRKRIDIEQYEDQYKESSIDSIVSDRERRT